MKRKNKSEMIHALPLPGYKALLPAVKCFACHNVFQKSEMNKAMKILPTYICDGCLPNYKGVLKFKKCLDKGE